MVEANVIYRCVSWGDVAKLPQNIRNIIGNINAHVTKTKRLISEANVPTKRFSQQRQKHKNFASSCLTSGLWTRGQNLLHELIWPKRTKTAIQVFSLLSEAFGSIPLSFRQIVQRHISIRMMCIGYLVDQALKDLVLIGLFQILGVMRRPKTSHSWIN